VIFEAINRVYEVLQTPGTLSLAASFIWGIFGMLLSPCSLIALPLVVGYIESTDDKGMKNAFVISAWFSMGIFANVAMVGIVIASAGALLAEVGRYTNYLVASVFILFGLHLLDIISIPWFKQAGGRKYKHRGPIGALILGLFSGLAVGPCAFAYLAPMLVIAMKASAANPYMGLGMVLFYAVGNCAVLVLAGTSAGFVSGFMKLDEKAGLTAKVNHFFGVVLILIGLLLIYKAP